MVANLPGPTLEPTMPFAKQSAEKQKELRYARALLKDKAEETLAPYRFDVLAQLANILARITLYELLRLSKSTREALVDAEVFMAQILAGPQEEDEEDCLHASHNAPCITFTLDDMQVKRKHDRPCSSQGTLDRLK